MRRKGPREPVSAYEIARIPSLMIYTDFNEYKIELSELLYMNYQTISSLQVRPLLKNSIHSFFIDLRDTRGDNTFCNSGYYSTCFDVSKSFQLSFLTKSTLQGISRQREKCFSALAQVIGRTGLPLLRKFVSPAAKRVRVDMIELLRRKLEML